MADGPELGDGVPLAGDVVIVPGVVIVTPLGETMYVDCVGEK